MCSANSTANSFPLHGHYLTTAELDAVMLGPEGDIVYLAFGETIENGQWVSIEVPVSRKTVIEGISGVLQDKILTAGLITDAMRVSELIRTGTKRSPGPQLLTDEVLSKYERLDSRQKRLTRTFLMDIVVSFVVRQHFREVANG